MRYAIPLTCLGAALLLLAGGAVARDRMVGKAEIRPDTSITLMRELEANERASAIVAGNGRSYLGLYIYDPDGNCIAHDDRANLETSDMAAVEWTPLVKGSYMVEVKNLGPARDAFYLTIR